MKITYKIEQRAIDDLVITITSPEYFLGIQTRIKTPYFLFSELKQAIKNNLIENIYNFCKRNGKAIAIDNRKYINVVERKYICIRNKEDFTEKDKKYIEAKNGEYIEELFEFELENIASSCWFCTGRLIDDTSSKISDLEREAIAYENLIRCDKSYSPSKSPLIHLIVNPNFTKKNPIKIKSLDPRKSIDVPRVRASLGVSEKIIYKWVENQKRYAPKKGNTYGEKIIFPRHKKDKYGRICFPISELQKYINILYYQGRMYPSLIQKYADIKKHLVKYSENHTA